MSMLHQGNFQASVPQHCDEDLRSPQALPDKNEMGGVVQVSQRFASCQGCCFLSGPGPGGGGTTQFRLDPTLRTLTHCSLHQIPDQIYVLLYHMKISKDDIWRTGGYLPDPPLDPPLPPHSSPEHEGAGRQSPRALFRRQPHHDVRTLRTRDT